MRIGGNTYDLQELAGPSVISGPSFRSWWIHHHSAKWTLSGSSWPLASSRSRRPVFKTRSHPAHEGHRDGGDHPPQDHHSRGHLGLGAVPPACSGW